MRDEHDGVSCGDSGDGDQADQGGDGDIVETIARQQDSASKGDGDIEKNLEGEVEALEVGEEEEDDDEQENGREEEDLLGRFLLREIVAFK